MSNQKNKEIKKNSEKVLTDAIFCIVNRGFNDLVMNAARAVGARGGTVINARGTSNQNIAKFYGIQVTPEKEIVLIVVTKDITDKVLLAINKEAGLDSPGQGIAFALPIKDYTGLNFEKKEVNSSGK